MHTTLIRVQLLQATTMTLTLPSLLLISMLQWLSTNSIVCLIRNRWFLTFSVFLPSTLQASTQQSPVFLASLTQAQLSSLFLVMLKHYPTSANLLRLFPEAQRQKAREISKLSTVFSTSLLTSEISLTTTLQVPFQLVSLTVSLPTSNST